MKFEYRIIIVLMIMVFLIWIIFDVIIKKEVQFTKDFEFSFESKTIQQIKNFAESALDDYLTSEKNNIQIRSLVNAIECNHFLLYANEMSENRFYDFISLILLPSQRIELKEKGKYAYEIKRYLRRKRNLELQYQKYEVSKPISSKNQKIKFLKIQVIRKNAEKNENLSYYFKKFNGRYYLYFRNRKSVAYFPVSNQPQNLQNITDE